MIVCCFSFVASISSRQIGECRCDKCDKAMETGRSRCGTPTTTTIRDGVRFRQATSAFFSLGVAACGPVEGTPPTSSPIISFYKLLDVYPTLGDNE